MVDKIIYPSIDLFVYDLKDGLGQDEVKTTQNLENFLLKIYGNPGETSSQEKRSQFQKYINNNSSAIELLESRIREFELPFDGYYYPLQLGDTYALQIDYSGKRKASCECNDEEQDINDQPFLSLKQEINKRVSDRQGTIGQTWLLWGRLSSGNTDEKIENIAQKCYTQIISNYNWQRDFIGKGSLLNGTIFELWYCPENLSTDRKEFWNKFRQESYHILIWLFPDSISPDEMREQVRMVYQDFIHLWQYRHKVVWAYYQSRYQKSILKAEYIEIQPSIKQATLLPSLIKKNRLELTQLQTALINNLINLSDYNIALNYLDIHKCTIEVNLENYKSRLGEIETKHFNIDLNFLKKFSDSEIYAKKYHQQLAVDYASFNPGLTLLQNLNSSIQGIVDLEQTKSDRKLNTTIALAGVGLATSQIASAVILAEIPKNKDSLTYQTSTFFWSLGIGAVAVILTWFILSRFRR